MNSSSEAVFMPIPGAVVVTWTPGTALLVVSDKAKVLGTLVDVDDDEDGSCCGCAVVGASGVGTSVGDGSASKSGRSSNATNDSWWMSALLESSILWIASAAESSSIFGSASDVRSSGNSSLTAIMTSRAAAAEDDEGCSGASSTLIAAEDVGTSNGTEVSSTRSAR